MAVGRSLHIGLNHLDPAGYEGWDGELHGCHNDAKDMAKIAGTSSFTSVTLLDKEASVQRVSEEIKKAAKASASGDLFFLTYSGHGGQIPDSDIDGWDDEPDGQDETWCLWNRQLIDDELYLLFSEFPAGVRVLVLSDSCHSGTVIRNYTEALKAAMAATPIPVAAGVASARAAIMPGIKVIDPDLSIRVYNKHKDEYVQAKKAAVTESTGKQIGSQVLLISGCQDNQSSSDGDGNGLFTATFKKIWNNGKFKGSYKKLHADISREMPIWQSPNFYSVGANLQLEKEKVLAI